MIGKIINIPGGKLMYTGFIVTDSYVEFQGSYIMWEMDKRQYTRSAYTRDFRIDINKLNIINDL